MRNIVAMLLWAVTLGLVPGATRADAGIQRILLGQVDCGPGGDGCRFANLVTEHRYLHVIVRDLPGNPDWQVRAGPDCATLGPPILGGVPIGANGYLEQVVDLSAVTGSGPTFAGCVSLEGRGEWWVSYYAAWFDESPTPDGDTVFPGYASLDGRPAAADLDVTYVHRDPALPYDALPNTPVRGQSVTFTAQVQNSGTEPADGFGYVWTLDGREVNAGTVAVGLAPGAETSVPFVWSWVPGPHDLQIRILPLGDDLSATNDTLNVRTDAISLGFWVEQSAYGYFARNQYLYCRDKGCAGSDSFGDWLQRQVTNWNRALATAIYPDLAPGGVADRIRVDAIHVVPDGALPLAGGKATDTPDTRDRSVDLQWGLTWSGVATTYRLGGDRGFDVDWALLHELGHARYLTDLYRFDAPANATVSIDVRAADGHPAVNAANPVDPTAPLPAFADQNGSLFYYRNQEQDLASCGCTPRYSAYTALTLNRIRGRRARCGNTNTPCNIGEWFGEVPADTRLRVEDRVGRPLPDGTTVRTFFDSGTGYTGHRFTDANSRTMALRDGEVDLGADPFQSRQSPAYAPQRLLLLEVTAPGIDMFCFLEPTDLNVAYWIGYRDRAHPATLTVQTGGQSANACNPSLPDPLVNNPFSVAPYRSSATLSPGRARNGRATQVLTVRLIGDGPAHDPMRGRVVQALDRRGRALASGTTSPAGTVSLRVPARAVRTVVDRTDNDLVIASMGGDYPPVRVRRR